MRQNTSSPRQSLPFQCFHTCTGPGRLQNLAILYVRGANHRRLRVSLVTFPQHEPVAVDMSYSGSSSGIHRFVCPMNIDSGANFQRYCFRIVLLSLPENGKESEALDKVWYSSLGMSREIPLLQHCFAFELFNTHPEWAPDLVCYEILPDRFASSQGHFSIDGQEVSAEEPLRERDFEYTDFNEVHFGGDLDGVANMLPYLRGLGCDCLILNSVFKAGSVTKEDVQDYDTVDPHFGGNGALKRLRALTMGYDMKLLLHGSFAHTGDTHPWFDRQERTGKGALHHEDSPYREYYTFKSDGDACYDLGSAGLPKLDYSSREVRHAMYKGVNSFTRKWLRQPYAIDGWVIDQIAAVGDNGSARNNLRRISEICQAARETHIDCLMLGNFKADPRYALGTAGSIDGSINYTGFLRPVRAFFGGVGLDGSPTPYTGEDLRRACEEYAVGLSQQAKVCLVNELDNATLPRFYSIIGKDRNLYLAALAAMYAWRGIPCIYQGDELGDVIASGQVGPTSMIPFKALADHHASPVSADIQSVLTELAAMRRGNPALTRGTMVFICAGGAFFGFIRIFDRRFSIVFVNASHQQVRIPQGSFLFPLLSAMYLPDDCHEDLSKDTGETLLIPLSGRNVRRTDHGEGLDPLYEMLARETLSVSCYGATGSSEELQTKFLKDLVSARNLTIPSRSTLIVNNSDRGNATQEIPASRS